MRLTSIRRRRRRRRRWRQRPEIFRRRWSVATPVGLHPSYVATDHRRFLTTNPGDYAVGRQSWFAFRPRQELSSVVSEFLGTHDVAIARLQSISEVDEDADLKRTSVKNTRLRSAFGDKVLPALRGKAEINLVRQFVAACMAMPAHDGDCLQQTAILRCRLDVQQIDKPEQQAAMSGVNWPEQR